MMKTGGVSSVVVVLVVVVIAVAAGGTYLLLTAPRASTPAVENQTPPTGDNNPPSGDNHPPTGDNQLESWVLGGYALQSATDAYLQMAEVIRLDDGRYRMFYGAGDYGAEGSTGTSIKSAISSDGITFTTEGTVLQNAASESDSEWDISGPSVVRLPDGRYRMYYQSMPKPQQTGEYKFHVRSAISTDGENFTKENGVRINIEYYDSSSPLTLAGHGTYFIASDNTYVAIFSGNFATDPTGPSDLKKATSSDGLTWGNFTTLYENWHDPIVLKVDNGYRMYATHLLTKEGAAFSSDGKTWPSQMTDIQFENQNGRVLSPSRDGIGDIGGVVLTNGNIRLFTNLKGPPQAIPYFDKA